MYPASFDYKRPATIDEAIALLTQQGGDAKLLAGGHSLIPAMKLRLARPKVVVDKARAAPGSCGGPAAIRLSAEAGATRLAFGADVQVGGLIAAVGSRLVEAAAKKLADDFFKHLSQELQTPPLA